MFGNKKGTTPSVSNSTSSSNINTLVEGTSAEGTINTSSDLRIDGQVNGTVNCGGKLIVGPTGNVEGDINSQNAVIEGRVQGNIIIQDILDVRETATVNGEIKTGKLLVQNGATFTGNCDMGHRIKNISNHEANAS